MLGYHHGQKYGNTTLPTTFIERLKERIVTENVSFDFITTDSWVARMTLCSLLGCTKVVFVGSQ